MTTAPRRAVVVRLSALGDIVHALPVAAALRRAWPATRLAWVVERRFAPILAGHPAIDEVITVDTRAWRRPRGPAGLAATVRAVLALRRHDVTGRVEHDDAERLYFHLARFLESLRNDRVGLLERERHRESPCSG